MQLPPPSAFGQLPPPPFQPPPPTGQPLLPPFSKSPQLDSGEGKPFKPVVRYVSKKTVIVKEEDLEKEEVYFLCGLYSFLCSY
jgi:hypothetical protein